MKTLCSYITPVITVTTLSGVITFTEVAQAAHITTQWNFNFTGEITGNGFLEIEEHQEGEETQTYEITDLQFTLDFGIGLDSQNVTLANFPDTTKPLYFSPDDTSNELWHTNFFAQFLPLLAPINPEWIQGSLEGVGNFTMSGSGQGVNTPDDPQGVGGIILFSSDESSPQTRTGTWTAQPVPEPLTILGSLTALSFGTFFKRSLKGKI